MKDKSALWATVRYFINKFLVTKWTRVYNVLMLLWKLGRQEEETLVQSVNIIASAQFEEVIAVVYSQVDKRVADVLSEPLKH